jgi:hypothetical protein
MATGHPPTGAVPAGKKRLKYRRFVPWTAGTPVRVPSAGITFEAVS